MSSEIEILTQKISSAGEITSEVVDAINSLALLLLEKNAAQAHLTSQKAVAEARTIRYPKGEAAGLIGAAMAASKQRNYEEAAELYDQAIRVLEKQNDKQQVAEVRKKLGNTKYYLGRYTEAIEN
ncbi:MAG TPA: tetratricopeptide repeat protein, partial [Chitinophagales bacterium]|nr:tetratricopeptide repeat protein [Chitinophagales bacterium]